MKNVLLSRPLKAARLTHSPSKVPFLGDRATVQRASDHSGGAAHMQEARSKIAIYSPESLVVASDRIKSNLQLRATQYQRFGAFLHFRMVHLESPNHICLTGCAQTYRWVGFFLCRTFLCRTSPGGIPSFADMVATIVLITGCGSLDIDYPLTQQWSSRKQAACRERLWCDQGG